MKMKNKKICLALSTVAMTAGFAFGGVFAFSQAMPIQAVAMETEFSNNGQFTVGQYSGPIEYVTGIAGADGEVLKMSTSGGWAAAKFDFSASQIKASEVDSIV
ncbi:MAG: hypothetical protein E7371_05150, partial [Clostridiales bacterium]|nr:hypothetical protein [Clostridiales bacterium]